MACSVVCYVSNVTSDKGEKTSKEKKSRKAIVIAIFFISFNLCIIYIVRFFKKSLWKTVLFFNVLETFLYILKFLNEWFIDCLLQWTKMNVNKIELIDIPLKKYRLWSVVFTGQIKIVDICLQHSGNNKAATETDIEYINLQYLHTKQSNQMSTSYKEIGWPEKISNKILSSQYMEYLKRYRIHL